MKKILILLTLLVTASLSTVAFAQDESSVCDSIGLETPEELKAAEPCVLKLAIYALSQPVDKSDETGEGIRSIVMLWSFNTPDYTFVLNDEVMACFEDDANSKFLAAYICGLTAAALGGQEDFHKIGLGLFVEYAKNDANGVKMKGKMKKLIKDWDKGKTDKYLNNDVKD